MLRQTFHDLRGATAWEANRLTIAGVSLVRGLDLEALTVDLSSLTKRRIGLDFQLDAFGGTLRASFQGRAGKNWPSTWLARLPTFRSRKFRRRPDLLSR